MWHFLAVASLASVTLLSLPTGAQTNAAAEANAAPDGGPAGPLQVVASIFPLGDIVREVGGAAVEVEVLLPPGAEPHGFEPTPQQAERLAQADLLVVIGLGADPWAQASAHASGNDALETLVFEDAVAVRRASIPIPGDPHVWLDPVLVREFTLPLAERLSALLPTQAEQIAARQADFSARLEALDKRYRRRLAETEHRSFVAFHSAFTYIAARYGLREAAVFDVHMHEPNPRTMEHVVQFIRRNQVPVVFAQPGMPVDRLDWLRQETGVRIGTLDPLGHPQRTGYDSYLALMESNLDALVAALGGAAAKDR